MPTTHSRHLSRLFLAFGTSLVLIALTTIVVLYLLKNKKLVTDQSTQTSSLIENILPQSSPLPFVEMTIPYLQARKYDSTIADLEKLAEKPSYTSYLTSYNSDGFRVNGLLTKPKQESQKFPAIVFVHGYIPPTTYQTTQNYEAYVDYLAQNGFVVFKIDLRGHGNSEGEARGSYYSPDYVIDVLNAYSALQKLSYVDPQKVGLWGHSMAGNIVMRSIVVKKDIPAAAIWAGAGYTYTDLQTYGIDDNSYRPPTSSSNTANLRRLLFETHGQFQAEHPFWKQVVPTNYLEGVKTAIGLFHAENDLVVSIEYSRGLQKVLSTTAIPNEIHQYGSGGHNLSGATFGNAVKDTVEFLEKYLK